MTQRIKLKPSDLAHRLAASLHRHVRLLADPAGRYELRVSHDACFEVAKQQAAEFERQNAEIFLEIPTPTAPRRAIRRKTGHSDMCNLYSMTSNQEAFRRLVVEIKQRSPSRLAV